MITNPKERIRIICTQLFPLIYHDYISGISDYDFALNKFNKYRNVAYQLSIEFEPHTYDIEQLDNCYNKYMSILKEKHNQSILT